MVELGPLAPWWPPNTPMPVAALVNPITGENVAMPPGTQIMGDDIDWMTRGWEAVFLIEWKIRQAEASAPAEPPTPSS